MTAEADLITYKIYEHIQTKEYSESRKKAGIQLVNRIQK